MEEEIHFNILGLSEATISQYLEAILVVYGPGTKATVIKNVAYTPQLPFEVAGIKHTITEDQGINFSEIENCLLGVHRPHVKKSVYDYFQNKHKIRAEAFTNLVSKHAVIASTDVLGLGNYIADNVVFSAYVTIGSYVTILKGTIIGHHTSIGDFCTFNQGVQIAGNCNIGEHVTIGMAAIIIDGTTIGKNSIIGAGALVTKDVPEGVVVYGVPAKIIRTIN